MRILQLSSFDTKFGAAIAARRLHEALLARGEESDFLVFEKLAHFPRTEAAYTGLAKIAAKIRQRIDYIPLKYHKPYSTSLFSPNWVSSNLPARIDDFKPEIIHLHWCQSNFVPTLTLPRMRRPMVWTLHDMWAFTGGCHYSAGCERYLAQCGRCPILKSESDSDLSHKLWKLKRRVYSQIRNSLQIVCPSNWLAGLARNAPLLEGIPVHVVPNPIDTCIFHPMEKIAARRLLGLPENGPLLLMGTATSYDKRKGFDLLVETLQKYDALADNEPIGLVIPGHKEDALLPSSSKFQVHHLEFVGEETRLAALYNAVDLVALPSREENLSNMLAEALCCGTPCLAFAIGGNGDLISHQVNGYLAQPFDTTEMAAGLNWILRNLGDDRRASIAQVADAQLSYEALVPNFLEIYRAGLNKPD